MIGVQTSNVAKWNLNSALTWPLLHPDFNHSFSSWMWKRLSSGISGSRWKRASRQPLQAHNLGCGWRWLGNIQLTEPPSDFWFQGGNSTPSVTAQLLISIFGLVKSRSEHKSPVCLALRRHRVNNMSWSSAILKLALGKGVGAGGWGCCWSDREDQGSGEVIEDWRVFFCHPSLKSQ